MAFVVEYHEELEADLLPEWDLLDVWRGHLSWRRLALLIRILPASGAVVRAINPEAAAAAGMPPEGYVLMDIFDLFARAKFQNPQPYPRPAELLKEQRRREARHAALERQRDRVNRRGR